MFFWPLCLVLYPVIRQLVEPLHQQARLYLPTLVLHTKCFVSRKTAMCATVSINNYIQLYERRVIEYNNIQ